MKRRSRIIRSIICCVFIVATVLFCIWLTTPQTDPVQIFRQAERQCLYKDSTIMGHEELFIRYDHAVLAEANHGYLLCEWRDGYGFVSNLNYYPKQDGITTFSSDSFIGEHTTAHQSIPLFVISDNYRAVTAKVSFRDFGKSGKQTYEQDVQRSNGGYFLFHIPCDKLGCPSRLAYFEGTYSVELFDSAGNLLETYQFTQ